MKKIILSSFLISLSLINTAQTNKVWPMLSQWGLTTDTVVGSATNYVQITSTGWSNTGAIQGVVTVHTGTLIPHHTTLQGSIDGINFLSIDGTDTMTCTGTGTSTHVWIIDGNPFNYYRISCTGAAGDSLFLSGTYLPNALSGIYKRSWNLLSQWGNISDTVTNTGTNTIYKQVKNNYQSLAVQVVCTKISGTQGGTVTLKGSLDGIHYEAVKTTYLKTIVPFTTGSSNTFTPTNVSVSSNLWIIKNAPYEYYQLSWTGTGTMSSALSGFITPAK